MACTYLINMKDGRFVFRNSETDHHVNLKPVPDEVVEMYRRHEITADDIIKAISLKVKESGEFDLEKYISELRKLNVRVSNPQELPVREALQDRSAETVSVSDILSAKTKESGAKDERAARPPKKTAEDVAKPAKHVMPFDI